VIYPVQYELEKSQHMECQRRAAHRRLVAEAEQLRSGDTVSAQFLPMIVNRLRWPVIRPRLVQFDEPLKRGAA
jgi:hypothetical protein